MIRSLPDFLIAQFLKIDTEGYEYEVIKGSRADSAPALSRSVHRAPRYTWKLAEVSQSDRPDDPNDQRLRLFPVQHVPQTCIRDRIGYSSVLHKIILESDELSGGGTFSWVSPRCTDRCPPGGPSKVSRFSVKAECGIFHFTQCPD